MSMQVPRRFISILSTSRQHLIIHLQQSQKSSMLYSKAALLNPLVTKFTHSCSHLKTHGGLLPNMPSCLPVKIMNVQLILSRGKTRKKTSSKEVSSGVESESDEEPEEEDDDQDNGKDFKILKGNINSTRVDVVLKFALGMSRNKVDNHFYNSSIYVNGEKLLKKSHMLTIEDEVDIVRAFNALNPDFIDISRVEILDAEQAHNDPAKVALKVRRFKRLTVENYKAPWKGVSE